MLATAREMNMRDKAEAAAISEALSERLEARNEEFVMRGFVALEKLKDGEPVTCGTELTVREIEVESERNQALISQLHSQLVGTTAELQAARQHIDTLGAQLQSERMKAPFSAMTQRVAQLTATVRGKERELTKLREALASLKEEMETLAADHSERMTRVSERAARAEAKAATETQASERVSALQERVAKLGEQIRVAKSREQSARRSATDSTEALRHAEGLASRASAEVVRLKSDVAALKAQLADVLRREEALKRQLATRTEQLEAMQQGPQPTGGGGATPGGGEIDRGRTRTVTAISAGDHAAAVAEAVANAIETERERWARVRAAVEEVQSARDQDERQRAVHATQLAHAGARLQEAEQHREAAVEQAAALQKALSAAEAELQRRGITDGGTASESGGSSGKANASFGIDLQSVAADQPAAKCPTADAEATELADVAWGLRRSQEYAADAVASSGAATHTVHTVGTAFGDGTGYGDRGGSRGGMLRLGTASSSIAVERWEAEKKLQKRVDSLRTKLAEKTRELTTSEGELVKARQELESAGRREQAMREGMVHAQDQLSRVGRDRENAIVGALAEMRSREELSAALHDCQQQLAHAQTALRSQRTAVKATGPDKQPTAHASAPSADADIDIASEGAAGSEMHAALLRRDQQIIELGFAVEAHEQTIAQLQARLRDQSAQILAFPGGSKSGGCGSGNSGCGGRGCDSGDGHGKGGGSVGVAGSREDLRMVVEKMERVIATLQKENAELRTRAVSSIKYVDLARDHRELKQHHKDALAQLSDVGNKLTTMREQADKQDATVMELAECRRQLKEETERTHAVRTKLVEVQGELATVRGDLGLATTAASPPQLAVSHAELQGQLRAAQAEMRSLHNELVYKGQAVVEMGSQLSGALKAATAAERNIRALQEQLVPQRELEEALRRTEARRDELEADQRATTLENETLHRRLRELGENITGEPETAPSAAVAEAVSAENVALRQENAAMAAELSALTPQFFEEIEDLKYAHATARDKLAIYEATYGALPI